MVPLTGFGPGSIRHFSMPPLRSITTLTGGTAACASAMAAES